jgi:hypothetical protein
MLFVDALAGESSDPLGEVADRLFRQAARLVALHGRLAETFDPDLSRAIGADLDDLVVR